MYIFTDEQNNIDGDIIQRGSDGTIEQGDIDIRFHKTAFTVDFQSADALPQKEELFWQTLIEKYLKPLDKDKAKEKRIQDDLVALRNKCCLFFFLLNTFLVTLVYALTQASAYAGSLTISVGCSRSSFAIEPISITFTVVFGILLVVQFLGLIWHRISTLIHVAASTSFYNQQSEFLELMISFEILQRCESSSTLRSQTSTNTDDYAFAFNNRKRKEMRKIMDARQGGSHKTLDDIVRDNLRRIMFDRVEGPRDGSGYQWHNMFRELNIKRYEEKRAIRNSYAALQQLISETRA